MTMRPIRDISYSSSFDESVAEVLSNPDFATDDRLMALEWELARAVNFEVYELVHVIDGVQVRILTTELLNDSAIMVVFSIEPNKIVLHGIANY